MYLTKPAQTFELITERYFFCFDPFPVTMFLKFYIGFNVGYKPWRIVFEVISSFRNKQIKRRVNGNIKSLQNYVDVMKLLAK